MQYTRIIVSLAVLAAACSSDPKPEKSGAASSKDSVGTEFVHVPTGSAGYVPAIRSFPAYYWSDTFKNACGGDYTIDLTVEFGEVTETTMHVNAVLVSYHAAPDVTMVPNSLDVYSTTSDSLRFFDESLESHFDGASHRYEVNHTFPIPTDVPLVVEFHSQAGLPSLDTSDFACGQDAMIAYVPDPFM